MPVPIANGSLIIRHPGRSWKYHISTLLAAGSIKLIHGEMYTIKRKPAQRCR